MKAKIKFVKFDLDALVAGMSAMKADERGAYMSMLLYLYQHEGQCPYDLELVAAICNCRRNFTKIWSKIEGKFVVKNNVLKHKTVTKKLREIRKLIQVKRRAGVTGAKARWQPHASANSKTMPNTNTNQNQIVNIGIGGANVDEMLDLDQRIREKVKFLSDHITQRFRPNKRSRTTLSKVLSYMVASIQADPSKEQWLTDAVEWVNIAAVDGKKARGAALFVEKAKEITGYGSQKRLLKGVTA